MKRYREVLAFGLAVFLLAGCGASAKNTASYTETAAGAPGYGYAADAEAPAEAPEAAAEEWSSAEQEAVPESGRKLIRTVNLYMETREFDTLLAGLEEKVAEVGGYIENSHVQGNSYYSRGGNRYAGLTLRIPSEKLDGFLNLVGELGNVTSRQESVEDITLRYVDAKSRKEALETEQERLLALLEKAESMEDIIAIESRLSEVRYQLESYGSTLRTYDNQVEYSTVTLDISEVERETSTLEKKSFLEEVNTRLSDNFYSIGRGFRQFAIWLLSSLPYLLLWAVGIVLLVFIGKQIFKKREKHVPEKKRFGRKGEKPKEEKAEEKEE